ncbi:histidine phosphatase family protein [Paenibacillus ehimensis]|uniref:histidine phosphatase family protein n=1 Tax=Paenibacillus ehimensis TaxID=79264 RepID=UPI001FE931AA|nr:histidine phosphatase family protein [Paenibacillus ehimensis]
MDLVFVIQGEAQHSLGLPGSRQMKDPQLTEKGRMDALRLRSLKPLSDTDAVIAGPTMRMLQTAELWCEGTSAARFAHPLAGPRQYPFRYDFHTMPCDMPLEPGRLAGLFPKWQMPADLPEYLWLQGIHTLPGLLFAQQADRFLAWCRALGKERVYVVTEAGTSRAYQAHLASARCGGTEKLLTQLEEDGGFALSVCSG